MNPALLGFGVALVCCLLGASGHSWWAVESLTGTRAASAERSAAAQSPGTEQPAAARFAAVQSSAVQFVAVRSAAAQSAAARSAAAQSAAAHAAEAQSADAERDQAEPDDDVSTPSSGTTGVLDIDGESTASGELGGTKLSSEDRPAQSVIHPLARLDEGVIRDLVTYDLASLGPMSIGDPNQGVLRNAMQFPEGPYWRLKDPERAWGTAETVQFMIHAIERVNEEYPETPVLWVGDLSEPQGGTLKRHKSHQSGRDVDVGYYYSDYMQWYRRATAKNLDRPRTWLLIRTLLADSPVEYIFMDISIQKLLRQEALAQGEDPVWLERVFDGNPGMNDSIIRHRRGHAGHFHVRFDNPIAEFSAARAYPWLVQGRLLPSRVAKYKKRRSRARL